MKEDWCKFCEIIISTNGNPSTRDATKCGIPFEKWLDIALNVPKEQLIKNAKLVLERYRRKA